MMRRRQWGKGSRKAGKGESPEECHEETQKEDIKVRKEEKDYLIVRKACEKNFMNLE